MDARFVNEILYTIFINLFSFRSRQQQVCFSEKIAENEWRKFSKRGGITLTLGFIEGIMLYGIVCPTRAPETQVYVKHS